MIEVNGKKREWRDETVQELLKRLNFKYPIVIVRIDGKMIPRDKFSSVRIKDNSRVEVIPIVSGG